MDALFLSLLDKSISASWVVAAVVLLRLVLKKAPRWLHCALWALVAVRLVSPFTIESMLSLVPELPSPQTAVEETLPETIQKLYWDESSTPGDRMTVSYQNERGENEIYEVYLAEDGTTRQVDPQQVQLDWPDIAYRIWLAGMAALLVYAAVSYLRLRKRVAASIELGNSVYLCDYINTPFILGIVKPKIYLPSEMEPKDAAHVLSHERAHLKRKDHWWKPVGFALLSVYWFNPAMWLAYCLLCRDIELACDERVVKDMPLTDKREYSEALLKCSVPRHMIAACPLAFGEVGVKERVKSVLRYKKPAFWVVLIAVVVCLVAGVCFLTDPVSEDVPPEEPATETMAKTTFLASHLPIASLDTYLTLKDLPVSEVQLWNRKGYTRLSTGQELGYAFSVLEKTVYDVQVAANEIVTDTVDEYGWSLPSLVFTCGENSFTLYFTQDFSLVWATDEVSASYPHSVKEPALLAAFFNEMLDQVRNEQTSGQPFATVDEPWKWMHGAGMDSIQGAKVGTAEGNYIYVATVSAYRLRPLLDILNQIPESAVTPGKYYEKNTDTDMFYGDATAKMRLSVRLADTVNDMIVILRCLDGQTQIILHEELDKLWNGGYKPQDVQVWNVDSQALTDCLTEMYEHTPDVTSFVGSDYEWDNTVSEVSGAGAAISMRFIAGWEREIVEYTEGCTSFGIRCRPAGVNEGWIYFSFWPEGYCPEEVNREYRECSHWGFYGYASYPIAITWPYGSGDGEHPWSYYRYYTDIGDYAIINEGADSWLREYEPEISAIQTFSKFTGGQQLERSVPTSKLEPIAYPQSGNAKAAPQRLQFSLADELTLTLGDGWIYDDTPDTRNGDPVLFSFWPEYETRGRITVEYREGFYYPGGSIATEDIRVYRPSGYYYEGKTGTVAGDDRWTYLWIDCKYGSFLFHFEDTEHWYEEKIDAAVSEIGEMGFTTYAE